MDSQIGDQPRTVSALNMHLGIRDSEIRLIAITVSSFVGGTILIFIVAWAVMQIVDRVKARRAKAKTRKLRLCEPGGLTKEKKTFEYKCKKDRRWDYFFRRREMRNSQVYDDEGLLSDVEAIRTRNVLYSSPGRDRIATLYQPRTQHAQDFELPRVPLPTYSPPLSSSRTSPELSYSPPSYHTDESLNDSSTFRARRVSVERGRSVLGDTNMLAQLRTENTEGFNLHYPAPTCIPSPPPPIYTSPAFTSTPNIRQRSDSPISGGSSPTFSPSLGMDLDYYMEWSGRDEGDSVSKEDSFDDVDNRPANSRRFGWPAFSALLPAHLDSFVSPSKSPGRIRTRREPLSPISSPAMSSSSSCPPSPTPPSPDTHISSPPTYHPYVPQPGSNAQARTVHRESGTGRGSGIGVVLSQYPAKVPRVRVVRVPVSRAISIAASPSTQAETSVHLKPVLSARSPDRPSRSVSFATEPLVSRPNIQRGSLAAASIYSAPSVYSVNTIADAEERKRETIRFSNMLDKMIRDSSLEMSVAEPSN
ncbi:hypothetical protein ONZ45_g3827 [Pleurotus djamor]|nr:hypothetical protein ONZ45_g3827 [Pleurotus djamor]